ncbi:hypothetical protein BUN12_0119 [Bacillus amyloliquefaciens]|nr:MULTISPECIES: hypothetical protein [Bacillus amyloliquefaciens group]AZV88383.1 hypothetical protein BUN12_0119 [Bacillus amyloliquefaciens]MEC1838099.1 hypothetical protein [Bacillus amyloliquefaciens]MEC1846780.1 hypothetical protein [Bacillus amyloliquefaciens]MEC1930473.1 hypothetical protein [Bacillus amyloliquefaciens]MEC2021127.1 hypothetical protein [Bacillus amyloliquefaciens]
MIDIIVKLSALLGTWLAILKLSLELRKMRKEAKAKERRIPTKKHRRRT